MNNLKGFIYGILSSATFGLIPLFTLPLMAGGMTFDTILFYRFVFASLAIGSLILWKKESFRITQKECLQLMILGILYASSALFLFWSYNFLSSGIATTIHFLYPVFVTLIMICIFREKKSGWTFFAILMAISGVTLLSSGNEEKTLNIMGIFIAAVSGLWYALYIIGVNKSDVRNIKGLKLTFYVLAFGSCLFFTLSQIKGTFQAIPDTQSLLNLVALAILPTVVSNLSLVLAVKRIGSTLTSILGAMEPVTAVCIGAFIFNEPFAPKLMTGILLIIAAVSTIILSKNLPVAINKLKRQLTESIIRKG